MQKVIITLILSVLPGLARAQKQESYIREGNELFKNGQLQQAIVFYDKVTDEKYKYTALLNKGTALYQLKKYDEAIKTYQQVSRAKDADVTLRSGAYYNSGVVYSNQHKIPESIEQYKNALRLNWKDNNARENLQKALSELQKQKSSGGSSDNPKPHPSKLSKSQAQQQLKRLEQKEKYTQDKLSNRKSQYGGSNGKDW